MPPAGCCGAICKEDCKRPPCPCNFDTYSPQELRQIAAENQRGKKS